MNRIDTVRVDKTAVSGASLTSVFLCQSSIVATAKQKEFSIELRLV